MSTPQDVDENKVNESKNVDKKSVILNLQNNFANISQYTNTTFINFLELTIYWMSDSNKENLFNIQLLEF